MLKKVKGDSLEDWIEVPSVFRLNRLFSCIGSKDPLKIGGWVSCGSAQACRKVSEGGGNNVLEGDSTGREDRSSCLLRHGVVNKFAADSKVRFGKIDRSVCGLSS